MLKKAAFSMLGGSLSLSFNLAVAYVLDYFMDAKVSNAISLLCGAILNFILQNKTFMKKVSTSHNILFKYLIAEIFIIGGSQLGVTFFINKKKEYLKKLPKPLQKEYNTIIRIITAIMGFIFISFPMRHFWVFN